MSLLMIPASEAIRSVIPDAQVFGPELYTSGGDWLSWARFFLAGWPEYFPIFTIHHYGPDHWSARNAVAQLWRVMEETGQRRVIWITEFNFDVTGERAIADRSCALYKHQTWERSFFFDLAGNGHFSLLMADNSPKAFLFPAFRAIVAGAYGCR
jgi:hypothetical protein